jgi:hypothetical protein
MRLTTDHANQIDSRAKRDYVFDKQFKFTQAEGLSEVSRGLERQRKPPVGSQNKYDPERVAETRIGRFWHPFWVLGFQHESVSIASLNPRLPSATHRVGKIKAAVLDCLSKT